MASTRPWLAQGLQVLVIGLVVVDSMAVTVLLPRVAAHLAAFDQTGEAYLTAEVTWHLLYALAQLDACTAVQSCANPQVLRPWAPRPPHSMSSLGAIPQTKQKKLLAVIDHGCPFLHPALQRRKVNNENKTAFHAIWDQDPNPDFPSAIGTTPQSFGYGRQVDNTAIQTWVNQSKTDRSEKVYADACVTTLRSSLSHGAAVLGLLAHNEWSAALSPPNGTDLAWDKDHTDLVFVQLPRSVPAAPGRGTVERYMLDAARYVLECAGGNCKDIAMVLDYGTEMGPHDGTSWFERAMDALVDEASVKGITFSLCFPAGNSYHKRRVATLWEPSDNSPEALTLGWHVPPGTRADAQMELWAHCPEALSELTVRPPDNQPPIAIDLKLRDAVQPVGDGLAVVKLHEGQLQVLFLVRPDASNPGAATRGVGVWHFALTLGTCRDAPVFLYTHWGGRNLGYSQWVWAPSFNATPVDLHSGAVRLGGAGSVWGSSCGDKTYMIGGYENWGTQDRPKYASASSGRRGTKPHGHEFVEPSEDRASPAGVLSLTNRASGLRRFRGTSFAVPRAAGRLVNRPGVVPPPAGKKTPSPGYVKKRSDSDAPRYPTP